MCYEKDSFHTNGQRLTKSTIGEEKTKLLEYKYLVHHEPFANNHNKLSSDLVTVVFRVTVYGSFFL